MEPQYKMGRSWWPGFRILDRYIVGKFLGHYIVAIAMIIVVVVIFDYVEKIDDFTEMHAPLSAILFDYYLNFIPFFINQFSGLFTFIAVIFFTSKLEQVLGDPRNRGNPLCSDLAAGFEETGDPDADLDCRGSSHCRNRCAPLT